MPEVRLIDANYLKHSRGIAGDEILHEIIDNQPTIEAEPVRHGRWTKDGCDCKYFYYKCSVCGEDNDGRTKFCPNCGAKMDGGAENG